MCPAQCFNPVSSVLGWFARPAQLHHATETYLACCLHLAAGDEIYREWGWNMFRAFERWTRLESGGYATINNVNAVSVFEGVELICLHMIAAPAGRVLTCLHHITL